MYRKNNAGQSVGFVLVNASTGAALTGATVTVRRALDTGAQASATGTVTELGNGQYRFDLSQADTNADVGSYLFTASGAVPVEKTLIFTAANPTDGVRFGLTALPNAAAGATSGVYVIGGTQPNFPAVPTATENATAVLAATVGVDTLSDLLVDMGAALVGKLSGADGNTQTVKAPGTDTTRLTYTTDTNGNRTAVTRSR